MPAESPKDAQPRAVSGLVALTGLRDDLLRVLEQAPVPLALSRATDGKLIAINHSAADLFALTTLPAGIPLPSPADPSGFFARPEDAERLRGSLTVAGARQTVEVEGRCGKELRWFSVSAVALEFGGELAVLSCFIDVHDRRRTEATLRERETRLKAITDAVPGVVYQYRAAGDGSFGFSFVSEGVRELLGLAPEQVLGQFDSVWELVVPEDRRGLAESMQHSLERMEPWHHEFRVDGGGATRWIRANATPERQPEGAVVWHGLMMDVTEQRQLSTQLQLADRLSSVGALAAGVAHEINNPLAYISSNLAFALEVLEGLPIRDRDLSSVVEALRDASEGTRRVGEIVQHLGSFSRPSGRDAERPLDVHRLIDVAVRMTRNEIKHRGRLIQELGDVLPVRGTESGLTQVFVNLLVNACEALSERTPDRNTIRLRTSMAGTRVLVEISDNGAGIPADALSRVFDPFFTTKPVGAGTGLGLTICHNVITSLGGEIALESKPSQGTRVSVLLPAVSFDDQPTLSAHQGFGDRTRVLVVDDERLVLSSLKRLLGREHDVVAVASGHDALQRIEAGDDFDIVLCDIMMPEMNGMELWEEVERRFPLLADRFFFLTGGAFTPELAKFRESVAERVLSKPLDPRQLQKLTQAARRHRVSTVGA